MSEIDVRRRALLTAGAAAPLLWLPASARAALAPGSHKLQVEAPTLGATAEPVTVYAHRPASWKADGPVALVLHGTNRDADRYLATWVPLAESAGVLVAVPEFSESKFPRRAFYNFGNVVDENMALRPRAAWTFPVADLAFEAVRREFGAQRERYALYGHSAGAQFAHRYLLLAQASRASLIITANAGSYTVPDAAVEFPWGLKNTDVTDADLTRAFAREVVILLGEQDNDPAHRTLPSDAQAKAQGPHRLARGQHFFERSRESAARLNVPFRWRLQTVPGVGHSDRGMSPAAMQLIVEAGR